MGVRPALTSILIHTRRSTCRTSHERSAGAPVTSAALITSLSLTRKPHLSLALHYVPQHRQQIGRLP